MFNKHTIDYDSRRKVFWVKVNGGQRYEKKDLDTLTRELTNMGVKWKLSNAAKKQVVAFKMKK